MPEPPLFAKFYPLAQAGFPLLLQRWRQQVDASDHDSLLLLSDTARLAGLGTPPVQLPKESVFAEWASTASTPAPLWLLKACLLLIVQMPRQQAPDSPPEQAAWSYLWLRLRAWSSMEVAQQALPAHLTGSLAPSLPAAWDDLQAQRLS